MHEVEQGQSLKKEFIPNPGHKPGVLPVFLKEKNENVIIAVGMGETAQDLFNQRSGKRHVYGSRYDIVIQKIAYLKQSIIREFKNLLSNLRRRIIL